MTTGWQRGRLIEFAEQVSTGPFGSMLHKSDYASAGVPLINPTNIVNEAIVPDADKQVGVKALSRLANYVLKVGDVVVGRRGEIGRCAVVGANEAGWVCGTGCFFIRPLPSTDSHFLAWLLRSPVYRDHLERAATGATMKNISNTNLAALPVAIPPVAEQRRIVAILDEAFNGIAIAKANAEKNRQNAFQVFESHLERVFARLCGLWPETTFGAIAAIKGGKRVPKGYKLLNDDTGYPYLRVTDFGPRGSIDTSNLRYVSSAVHTEIKNYIITSRDLYISIAGTIGRTGIIPDELDGANLTENACRLVFNSDVCNRFVYYYTKTPAFFEQAAFNTRTAAQPKLALSRLATIRLPMPNLEVQATVATSLDAIADRVESLEGIYQSKTKALDELQKSLLHQAFTGVLTAKVTDEQLEAVA